MHGTYACVCSYIGIYGNADPLDINQWFALDFESSTSSRTWAGNDPYFVLNISVVVICHNAGPEDGVSGICSNMLTSLDYEFLVTRSGEKSNAQNKIVAAKASFTTSDWKLR
jgi:hypothetical protein